MGKTRSRSDGKSHADRKFEKKMQFYELVRGAVAKKTISKEKQQRKRSRQKKLKAYDLSALSEFLPEINTSKKSEPVELKINCKRRNKILLKEIEQMNKVIEEEKIQSDPIDAIYEHLQKTQPDTDEKPKKKGSKTRKGRAKKKKSKAVQAMQM